MPNPESKQEVARRPSAARRWRILKWLVVLVLVWFFGDFAYSRYVDYRITQWESSVPWTKNGFTPDATEFTRGSGEVALLMVHGFSDTPQMFRKMAPALAEKGFTTRAILLPGFGQDIEAYANASTKKWLAKVATEVETLSETHEQVWIVAHSLGGAITINHVLEHPNSVDGLVLLAPAIEVSSERSPGFSTRFWHEFSKWMLPFTQTTCSPFAMDAHDPAERDREHRNIFTPASMVDNTFSLIDANRGRANEIQLPALVFLSTTDQVVDSEAIESFFDQLGSNRTKLIRLENSGHMLPVDMEWREIVDALDEFLAVHARE